MQRAPLVEGITVVRQFEGLKKLAGGKVTPDRRAISYGPLCDGALAHADDIGNGDRDGVIALDHGNVLRRGYVVRAGAGEGAVVLMDLETGLWERRRQPVANRDIEVGELPLFEHRSKRWHGTDDNERVRAVSAVSIIPDDRSCGLLKLRGNSSWKSSAPGALGWPWNGGLGDSLWWRRVARAIAAGDLSPVRDDSGRKNTDE